MWNIKLYRRSLACIDASAIAKFDRESTEPARDSQAFAWSRELAPTSAFAGDIALGDLAVLSRCQTSPGGLKSSWLSGVGRTAEPYVEFGMVWIASWFIQSAEMS
jgi:hypothetical protein